MFCILYDIYKQRYFVVLRLWNSLNWLSVWAADQTLCQEWVSWSDERSSTCNISVFVFSDAAWLLGISSILLYVDVQHLLCLNLKGLECFFFPFLNLSHLFISSHYFRQISFLSCDTEIIVLSRQPWSLETFPFLLYPLSLFTS